MDKGILCSKCRKVYPPSKIRYMHDTKNMICQDCIEKQKNPAKNDKEVIKTERKKTRYKCSKCKHTFMLKEGFNKQCPFCGSSNIEIHEWNSDVDALIQESTNRIYDH